MSWRQKVLRKSLRIGAAGLLVLIVVAAVLWGSLALWFALPIATEARLMMAVLFAGLGIGGLIMALRHRRLFLPLLPFTIALTVLLVWWSTIDPSNDRAWQPDVARLPSAEIDGDLVTLRNVRSFEYRSAADYTEHWHDRTVDLRRLDSLDLIAVYWMGDAIAHTMLSFGFAGEPVTISVETRKAQSEEYSTLAGFFRRYELYYVVADERDLIGLRTTYRQPPEDVYLYRVHAPEENIRRLFLEYLARINQLREQPELPGPAAARAGRARIGMAVTIESCRRHPQAGGSRSSSSGSGGLATTAVSPSRHNVGVDPPGIGPSTAVTRLLVQRVPVDYEGRLSGLWRRLMAVIASPDDLPSLFASAWNAHDIAALVLLFAEDADFVNVAGIWWRDRSAIEEAHGFAHRTFFRNSRLQIDDVAVKHLRRDLVTVHSTWTLSGQEEPDGSVGHPRRGILLLVASQEPDGWRIRTAQNTDIVPEALTVPAGTGSS